MLKKYDEALKRKESERLIGFEHSTAVVKPKPLFTSDSKRFKNIIVCLMHILGLTSSRFFYRLNETLDLIWCDVRIHSMP